MWGTPKNVIFLTNMVNFGALAPSKREVTQEHYPFPLYVFKSRGWNSHNLTIKPIINMANFLVLAIYDRYHKNVMADEEKFTSFSNSAHPK